MSAAIAVEHLKPHSIMKTTVQTHLENSSDAPNHGEFSAKTAKCIRDSRRNLRLCLDPMTSFERLTNMQRTTTAETDKQ